MTTVIHQQEYFSIAVNWIRNIFCIPRDTSCLPIEEESQAEESLAEETQVEETQVEETQLKESLVEESLAKQKEYLNVEKNSNLKKETLHKYNSIPLHQYAAMARENFQV